MGVGVVERRASDGGTGEVADHERPGGREAVGVAVASECARSRALVERAVLLCREVRQQRLRRRLEALLVNALRDEEIAVGVAWVVRFGPIPTDEQFAAILRTVALGRRRRNRERGAGDG
jgi:hypothetical protein